MLNSMTGYGNAQKRKNGIEYSIEIKSVNSRFVDIKTHQGHKIALSSTHAIEKLLKSQISRGKFDVNIHVKASKNDTSKNISFGSIDAVLKQFKKAGKNNGFFKDVSLDTLVALNRDWFFEKEDHIDAAFLMSLAKSSILKLKTSRKNEGKALMKVLKGFLKDLSASTFSIFKTSKLKIKNKEKAFKEKIKVKGISDIEIQKIEADWNMLKDKMDLTEEHDRLKVHVKSFEKLLIKGSPVGRELDFLVQEMNREVNTMGSKSSDASISEFIVGSKSILEKIREQVQNIE